MTTTGRGLAVPTGVYDPHRTLAARPATDAEVEQLWPRPWRAVERREDGTLLSFFTADDEHVVTRPRKWAFFDPTARSCAPATRLRPTLFRSP